MTAEHEFFDGPGAVFVEELTEAFLGSEPTAQRYHPADRETAELMRAVLGARIARMPGCPHWRAITRSRSVPKTRADRRRATRALQRAYARAGTAFVALLGLNVAACSDCWRDGSASAQASPVPDDRCDLCLREVPDNWFHPFSVSLGPTYVAAELCVPCHDLLMPHEHHHDVRENR